MPSELRIGEWEKSRECTGTEGSAMTDKQGMRVRLILKDTSWPAPTYEAIIEHITIDLPVPDELQERLSTLFAHSDFAKCCILGAEFKPQ